MGFICFNTVYAQEKNKFGVRAGMNLSTVGNTVLNYKPGFHFGLFKEFNPSEHFVVQPEFAYSAQGGSLESHNFPLHYLSLGLNSKARIEKVVLLMAGASVDYQVGGFKSFASKLDFTGFIGLGYQFRNGTVLDFRYKSGIFDVMDEFETDNTASSWFDLTSNTNRVFQLGLSYPLKMK